MRAKFSQEFVSAQRELAEVSLVKTAASTSAEELLGVLELTAETTHGPEKDY